MKNRILILIPLFAIITFLGYSIIKAPVLTHGFASYYTFSRILLEEKNVSKSYDTTYFNSKIKEYGMSNIHEIANIPTSSFLFLPLAWLSPQAAKEIWTALLVIFLFISTIILLNVFDVNYRTVFGFLFLSTPFLFYPAYYNIALGQVYILILLLFSISIYGLKKNNAWLVSIPLALIILTKGYGLIPLMFLIIFKKWKESLIAIAFVISAIIITIPLITTETWGIYYQKVFLGVGFDSFSSNVAYQTINGLMRHIFIYDPVYNSNSLLNLNNNIVNGLVFVTGLFVLAFIIFQNRKENFVLLYIAAISLNLILAPVAEEYHYVLFLPLIFLLGNFYYDNLKRLKIGFAFFVLSFILLAAPLPYKSLQYSKFPVFLLAYPKLYAGITMLVLALSFLRTRQGIQNKGIT
jgi:hypothetical protein